MDYLITNLPFLLKGLLNTIMLSLCCLALSLMAGMVIGILRTANIKIVALFAKLYIEVFRGLPVLVTLFIIYFTLPELNIHVNAFLSATIGLSLWSSANVGQSVKGAIESISVTQREASFSLGLNYAKTMQYIIIPQAMRRIVPSIVGLLINLIHATSLTVLISNKELLRSAQIIIERLLMIDGIAASLSLYLVVLLGYFIICYPLSKLASYLERNLSLGS